LAMPASVGSIKTWAASPHRRPHHPTRYSFFRMLSTHLAPGCRLAAAAHFICRARVYIRRRYLFLISQVYAISGHRSFGQLT
jgi:hypothetical protein